MNATGGNRSCGEGGGGGDGEEPPPLPTFSTAAKVRVALTCLLFLSSACCNGAVLWAAARAPRRRPPPRVRLLMANLAAADLLVTVVVMPLDAAWNATVQWYGGEAACRGLMFLKLAAMYASAFVTVVIALDRHAAIVTPLAVGGAERRNKALLGAAWGLSALLALPQVGEDFGGSEDEEEEDEGEGGRLLTAPRPPIPPAGLRLPHGEPLAAAALRAVRHRGQLRGALAGDALQHVHLRLPLPAAAARHGALLRPHPRRHLGQDEGGRR